MTQLYLRISRCLFLGARCWQRPKWCRSISLSSRTAKQSSRSFLIFEVHNRLVWLLLGRSSNNAVDISILEGVGGCFLHSTPKKLQKFTRHPIKVSFFRHFVTYMPRSSCYAFKHHVFTPLSVCLRAFQLRFCWWNFKLNEWISEVKSEKLLMAFIITHIFDTISSWLSTRSDC